MKETEHEEGVDDKKSEYRWLWMVKINSEGRKPWMDNNKGHNEWGNGELMQEWMDGNEWRNIWKYCMDHGNQRK